MDKHLSGPADAPGARNVAEEPTVATLLAAARALGIDRLDAEVLLQSLLRCSRAQLIAFDEAPVEPLAAAMFQVAAERRAAGEPLAYITGTREFWSLPLVVSPEVLIPRPETELLVERCLALLDAGPHRVADLGTGSGAIAMALAQERPAWHLVATDASPGALQVAAANRRRLGASNVDLRQGHWCEALGDERFDAIVSNPPYVDASHPALASLQHEPRSALVAPDQGYADLIAIAAGARTHLRAGGHLLLEHGMEQSARLARELEALGYQSVHCHRDLAGLDRVTAAIWP